MKTISIAVFFAAVLLAGCASNRAPNAPEAAPAAPAVAAPATPIVVPAASAKRMVLHLTGSKTAMEAKNWKAFKDEWRDTFADHAKEAGIAFGFQDGATRSTGEAGTLVEVYVNDYRMVGIGARMFLGIMTGNAYIDAKVRFQDLRNGALFGEQSYNTSSSAWHGLFGKMTPQQVDMIATNVVGELKKAR